jgi:Holliday junction resolvase-like predicted endonuclease
VSFQAAAGAQGRSFESAVIAQLTMAGWTVIEQHWREPSTLIEIDIIARDPTGRIWWIECKGSWLSESGRNGCLRTDTVKKLIGAAALLTLAPHRELYMLVTSDLPERGSAQRWLDLAGDAGWIDRFEVLTTFGKRFAP